ncbi:MAG: hypothetical protein Fur0021_02990 [Candidatus Promineifilaceae bacterium]
MANSAFEHDVVEFEDVDLFAEDIEERLNAGTTSCIASGTSVSTASSCWCSFSTIGSACTGGSFVEG